jgi:hypothetical protein
MARIARSGLKISDE